MAIEQTIFYPAVREIDPELVGESYQGHAIAEMAPKLVALKELIEHHVEEEEEELFPEVEEKMESEELESMGDEMLAAFEEASERGHEALLPEGLTASGDRADQEATLSRRNGRPRPIQP
jgi:thioredoxin-like negative regulator of GroEL